MLARLHSEMSAREWAEELAKLVSLPDPYVGFFALDEAGNPIGMIDLRIRNFAEGAPDLGAPYVEDLWVEPEYRRRGVARLLLESVENWAREQGYRWLGSDARLDNEESQHWHLAAGFAEQERLVVFGKPLR
jgi:aminoglycoside 6'-N-acetyltransferase I